MFIIFDSVMNVLCVNIFLHNINYFMVVLYHNFVQKIIEENDNVEPPFFVPFVELI